MNIANHFRSPIYGVAFGLFSWLLSLWAHEHPVFVEHWYSRGLFQCIRVAIDHTLGRLPVPAFYIFWAAVGLFWIFSIWKRPRLRGFWQKAVFWVAKTLGFAGFLLGLFFWVWGFNYARVPLAEQLGLQLEPLDSSMLWEALRRETHIVDSLRLHLTGGDTSALEDEHLWPSHAEDTVRAAVAIWLRYEGFPVNGRVRARMLYPEGCLFKFGASGVYWPFAGESNVEAGQHALRKLPVMAHEIGHGYGFCDEGVCNFIAFAACCAHPNPYVAYVAHLDYWRTLAQNCRETDPPHYDETFRPFIPAGIRQDERAVCRQHAKFRELAPAVRYELYDAYLKSQGIAAGMLNYEEVLMLVRAWQRKGSGIRSR